MRLAVLFPSRANISTKLTVFMVNKRKLKMRKYQEERKNFLDLMKKPTHLRT